MLPTLASPAPWPTQDPTLEPQALPSLLEALAEVADPRHARGIRHPLAALLALCVLAFVCGRQNLSAVRRFAQQHPALLTALGFPKPRAPSVPTLSRVLGTLEPHSLQRALGGWMSRLLEVLRRRRRGADTARVAAVDGKTSCAAGVHVLNVFLHDLELVLWQAPVEGKQNEISAFKQALAGLLAAYPFLALITGDAMFAGEPLCALIVENGRHYLFQIKADQPDLLEKLSLVFAPQLQRSLDEAVLEGEKKRRLRRRP